MAHKLGDMIKQTSASIGATTLALRAAAVPFRDFSTLLSDGDTTEVVAVNRTTGEWQAAVYSYAAGVLTFDSTHFFASSTGSAITFATGIKDVFIGPIAERGKPFLRTANFAALPLVYNVDTSAGQIVATMPAAPAEADAFLFNDFAGTWGTYNLILDGNGEQFDDGTGVLKDRMILDGSARLAVIYADGVYTIR